MEGLDITQLPASIRELLARYGFDPVRFASLRQKLRQSLVQGGFDNVVRGKIEPAQGDDVIALPGLGTPERAALAAHGEELMRQGRVAVVVLCGGMATRFGGVVKANVPVLEQRTFLDLKLRDAECAAVRVGGRLPAYLMTSFATDAEVTRSAAHSASRTHCSDRPHLSQVVPVTTFAQFVSLRLTPEGELFLTADGLPSPYATGHGDLAPALRRSRCLEAMVREGVRHIFMSNVDNLAATVDPAVIGAHAESGKAMTFEVTETRAGDKGGAPVRVDGRLQVLEAFRFPADLDPRCTQLFSTNSFVLDVDALDRDFDFTWFKVEKHVEGRSAIQFERLVNELSAFLPCQGLVVSRAGADDRFIPIKEPADLQTERARIENVLRERRVL